MQEAPVEPRGSLGNGAAGTLALRFLVALIAIDALLIGANLSFYVPSFLDLDHERNLPTWYSSAKLLLTSLAALACAYLQPAWLRRGLHRFVWPTVALLFAALSMDETATAHERLAAAWMSGSEGEGLRARLLGGDSAKDAFIWPVLFAPIILAILGFLAHALWTRIEDRRYLALGVGGCVGFVAALVLEGPVVYLSPPVEAWSAAEVARYSLFAVFEESAEVIGTTLMLASLLLHAASEFDRRSCSTNAASTIP